jgi:hypothetical protein
MWLLKFAVAVIVVVLTAPYSSAFAQQSKKPIVVRRVRPSLIRDASLEAAIASVIYGGLAIEESDEVRYHYNRVDLNGDKKPEVLVFVFGRGMCGTSGCGALIFRARGRRYELLTEVGPARNPVIVSQHRSRGWNDLVMFVAGGGILPGYYAVLRFDGKTYPENPTVAPAQPLEERVKGTAYLVGDYSPDAGMALRPPRRKLTRG